MPNDETPNLPMFGQRGPNRRTVLKTIGGGIIGGSVLTGTATGKQQGIGSFLNEEALFKNHPIWKTGIADNTGQDEVVVKVGTMTSIDIPENVPLPPHLDEPPEEGPFAFTPRAIEVSPETTVKWEWTGNPFAFRPGEPWPHDVASLEETDDGHPVFHSDTQGTGTFEWEFNESGSHLFYCHPHGNPMPDHPNLFGMRGAVVVTDE